MRPINVLTNFTSTFKKELSLKNTLLCSRFEDLDQAKSYNLDNSTSGKYPRLFELQERDINKFTYWRDAVENLNSQEAFDFIVADLPLNVRFKDGKYNLEFNAAENLLQNLSDSGFLLSVFTPPLFYSRRGKKFLNSFIEQDFYPHGVFETPQDTLKPTSSIQPLLVVFSKDKTDKLFICKLNNDSNISKVVDNFISKNNTKDLYSGTVVSFNDFSSFENLEIKKQIESLQTQFKEYKQGSFADLTLDIKTGKKKNLDGKDSCIYLSRVAYLDNNIFKDIGELDGAKTYIQIEVDKEKIIPDFLKMFLNTELGNLILKSSASGVAAPIIKTSTLKDLSIPLPSIKEQKNISETSSKLNEVVNEVRSIQKDLSLNPKNSSELNELSNNLLDKLGALSKADQVREMVRKGETKKVEFKQTFSKNIHTNKRDKKIEKTALKNIVGFLNKDGGTLIVGVTDKGEFYDVRKDFFNSKDKYKLRIKDMIVDRIGKEYFSYIDHELIDVGGNLILKITCKPSDTPAYLDDEEFYVRVNPAAEELRGREMNKYINTHFDSGDSKTTWG